VKVSTLIFLESTSFFNKNPLLKALFGGVSGGVMGMGFTIFMHAMQGREFATGMDFQKDSIRENARELLGV